MWAQNPVGKSSGVSFGALGLRAFNSYDNSASFQDFSLWHFSPRMTLLLSHKETYVQRGSTYSKAWSETVELLMNPSWRLLDRQQQMSPPVPVWPTLPLPVCLLAFPLSQNSLLCRYKLLIKLELHVRLLIQILEGKKRNKRKENRSKVSWAFPCPSSTRHVSPPSRTPGGLW